eukprot:6588091-Pyramimonas_sp.AAC.1
MLILCPPWGDGGIAARSDRWTGGLVDHGGPVDQWTGGPVDWHGGPVDRWTGGPVDISWTTGGRPVDWWTDGP